jgi:hypothetical protein
VTIKTKRLNLTVDVNSGSALLLFLGSFFLLLLGVAVSPAVERSFIPALTGLTGAVGGFFVKRSNNNRIALEETKLNASCENGTPTK